ncbi:hypothetical protein [uncultured Sphingomonas sp.]|uniref:hypothetical protein n=1 Tax=uncultured Sphingomonas sp. TaxID=158754 RepID=UPI003749BDC5
MQPIAKLAGGLPGLQPSAGKDGAHHRHLDADSHLDLSFARFHGHQVSALPVELAVLLVGVASRQAASPTARVQATIARLGPVDALLAPVAGCFSATTAQALRRWKEE